MATITKDIIALAKKIDNAQKWDMDDCKALCEALVGKAVEIVLKDSEPVYLSVDNGTTYIAADEDAELQAAIDKVGWDEIVSYMDDDAREQAHYDVAPCTELEYLKHYLEIAPCDLVIG